MSHVLAWPECGTPGGRTGGANEEGVWGATCNTVLDWTGTEAEQEVDGRNGQGRQKAKAFDTYAEHCCVSSIETSRITSGRSPPCGTHSNAVTKVASSPWEKELGVEKIGTLINREEMKSEYICIVPLFAVCTTR